MTSDDRSGDSSSGELRACILQIAATDGIYGRGIVFIGQLCQRIVGHNDEMIVCVAETLDASHGWVEYSRGEFRVDREKALEEAQRLRSDVYW